MIKNWFFCANNTQVENSVYKPVSCTRLLNEHSVLTFDYGLYETQMNRLPRLDNQLWNISIYLYKRTQICKTCDSRETVLQAFWLRETWFKYSWDTVGTVCRDMGVRAHSLVKATGSLGKLSLTRMFGGPLGKFFIHSFNSILYRRKREWFYFEITSHIKSTLTTHILICSVYEG